MDIPAQKPIEESMSETKHDTGQVPETIPPPAERSASEELRALFDEFKPQIAQEVAKTVSDDIAAGAAKREDSARNRQDIVSSAKPALGDDYSVEGKTDEAVMRDAIVARQPGLKVRADAAEGDALRGMFDAIMAIPVHALGDFAGSAPRSDTGSDSWQLKYDAARSAFLNKRIGGVELCRAIDSGEIAVGA
ncbi:MAG: hypothetical protein GKR86_16480 [Ilumatobacter sp.]|nr:hypothetical protein [Ilumatobacter sp.]